MKLHGLIPNSYIHDIPRIGLPIWLQQKGQTNPGNMSITHRCMNVGIGRQNFTILFWK